MLLNPYRFAVASAGVSGALATSTGQTAPSGDMSWPTLVYDTATYYTDGTSTQEASYTIPTGVSLIRMAGFAILPGGRTITGKKNGVNDVGHIRAGFGYPSPTWSSYGTGPLAAASGNTFQKIISSNYTSGWFGIEKLPATLKFCTVRKTANQASIVGTQAITWDAEIADAEGWHDNTTNNSRITVPANGVSRVRVTANIKDGTAYNSTVNYFMQKNGVSEVGLPRLSGGAFTIEFFSLASAVIPVSGSQYLELKSTDTATVRQVEAGNSTWFSVEDASDAVGALVYKAATQSLSAGVDTAVAFTGEAYDDATCHDNSTNNTRLTVPSGYSWARLTFGIEGASGAGDASYAYVRKNGSGTEPGGGLPGHCANQSGTDYMNGRGAWVQVSAGDYFELMMKSTNAQTLPVSNQTFFAIELK